MAQYPVFVNGVQRELYDDDTRTYTTWDEDGDLIQALPYTTQQNAAADARAANAGMAVNRKVKSDRVTGKRAANVDFIASTPNNQQLVAQVKDLTQQVIDLTDLVLQSFDTA